MVSVLLTENLFLPIFPFLPQVFDYSKIRIIIITITLTLCDDYRWSSISLDLPAQLELPLHLDLVAGV